MKLSKRLLILSTLLFTFFPFSLSGAINLEQSGWGLGGKVLLNLRISDGADVALDLSLEPEVSYLVADQFEVFVDLKLKVNLITPHDEEGSQLVTWGSSFGPRYYFTKTRFSPYLGGSYGFLFDNFRAESFRFNYTLEPGALYGINAYSALNFSVPFSAYFTAHHQFKGLSLVPSLFGLKTVIR